MTSTTMTKKEILAEARRIKKTYDQNDALGTFPLSVFVEQVKELHKLSKRKEDYKSLAETLIELETESIANDPELHFGNLGNGWEYKYGNDSMKHASKFVTKQGDVKKLAKMIEKDFNDSVFVPNEDGSLYDPEMRSHYGDFICVRLEAQLKRFLRKK